MLFCLKIVNFLKSSKLWFFVENLKILNNILKTENGNYLKIENLNIDKRKCSWKVKNLDFLLKISKY